MTRIHNLLLINFFVILDSDFDLELELYFYLYTVNLSEYIIIKKKQSFPYFTFLKPASSTLKTELMAGRRLVRRLTTSRPMVITLQLVTEDSLPINRGTGGLEDTKTDPLKQHQREKFKKMHLKEILLLHSLLSGGRTYRF